MDFQISDFFRIKQFSSHEAKSTPMFYPEIILTLIFGFCIQIDSASNPCAEFYFRSQQLSKFDDLSSIQQNYQHASIPFHSSSTTLDHSSQDSPFAELESALSAQLTLIVLWKVIKNPKYHLSLLYLH